MATNFIPAFHKVPPAEKMKPKFCLDVVNYYYRNTRNYNLLWNKRVQEIDQYAAGEFDLTPFKRMFKSEQKKMQTLGATNPNMVNVNDTTAIGFDYTCLSLIPEKINSATAIIQKIPIEIKCNATDPLAIKKKQADINFLKNKAEIEMDLQPIADKLQLGEVDLGSTKNSAVEYSDSPFGLDLNDPDQLDIFVNLIYSLKIESSFETALTAFAELKNINQVKLLEIKDQMKYAISVNSAFENSLTGLPDAKYVYPGDIEVPWSELPDYSDRSHTIENIYCTPAQLWNYFGDEIGHEDNLMEIMTENKFGYCACNNQPNINRGNLDTFKILLKKIEVISIDWVGIDKKKNSLTDDETQADEKIWAQNTYSFYWLYNTDKIYGIERLPFSMRTKGKESYQNFSYNIYKSHEKGAVELCIGENKNAQIAYIKMTHALIKSLPPGRYIDMHFLSNAASSLKDEQNEYTTQNLLNLAMEQNVIIGDTAGFEGKNDGQFKPVIDLAGGLGNITGYLNIIASANINISRITGINDQLTGQSPNPDMLVGLQKLLINAGINSLQYGVDAIKQQYQRLYTIWANIIEEAIEHGGKPKEFIVNIIGNKKANIIDGLDDTSLHQIGIFVKVGQREEERARFDERFAMMIASGVISASDQFLIDSIDNIRDKFAVLAVKEERFKKEQAIIREQQFEQNQAIVAQQGQNQAQAQNLKTDGAIKEVYAKGDVQAKITQLANQLGISQAQLQGLIKKDLQTDRNNAQLNKSLETLNKKSELTQQESLI